jgi:hypothetical protein
LERDVVETARVPQHNVGVLNAPVLAGVCVIVIKGQLEKPM